MNATDQLAALAHPQRLALFRLLMRRYPQAVPAGELAEAMGVRQNTLSAWLSALRQADLISQTRDGRSLRYQVRMDRAEALMTYLFADCLRGRANIPRPTIAPVGGSPMADRKFNVLFICTGNSARSIFAETLLRDLAGARFTAYSAGTKPYSELNPFALQVLRDKGHDISPLRSKNIAEFAGPDAPALDFVFTVCDQAANEECPAWEGQPVSGHWGMPDPVKATGTDAQKGLAFQHAYGALRRRIELFTALPIASLDRIALQSAVDEIGRDPIDAT